MKRCAQHFGREKLIAFLPAVLSQGFIHQALTVGRMLGSRPEH